MSKSQLDEAIEWLEQGRFLIDPTEDDWQNAFSKVNEHLAHNPLDWGAHYTLGYGYFSKGDNKKYPEIETHLQRSLELKANMPFPQFFLGMYYFNCGYYEKSLFVLSEIALSFFTSIGQSYRISEVIEVMLCNRLYINPTEVPILDVAETSRELIRLAELHAEEMDCDDFTYAVTPYGLARCVDSLFQREGMQEKAAQMFEIVFDLLVKLDQEKYAARVVERVRTRLGATTSPSGASAESC